MDLKKNIQSVEKLIGYTFKDKSLLCQAFTRTSYCNEHNKPKAQKYTSNEVLEFFGDSVLSTAIVSLLLEKKTERYENGIKTPLDEGDFSNIRSKLSDKTNLSRITAGLGLQKYLIMGEGDKKLGIENEPSVMEDLFESIIGAVYIDCEMSIKPVIEVVRGLLDVNLYLNSAPPIQSAKNALQEWCQDKKHRLPPPIYKVISESGPDHKKLYECGCYIGEKLYGIGVEKSTKLAETSAAEKTLEMLKKEKKANAPEAGVILTKLKSYAASRKLAGPEFRDRGESERSSAQSPEYIIECRFNGITVVEVGASKQEARAAAAAKILKELEKPAENAKHPKKKKAPLIFNKAETKKMLQKGKADGKVKLSSSITKKAPHHHTKRS